MHNCSTSVNYPISSVVLNNTRSVYFMLHFFCTSFMSPWPLWEAVLKAVFFLIQPWYPHQSYLEKILFWKIFSIKKKKTHAVSRLKPMNGVSLFLTYFQPTVVCVLCKFHHFPCHGVKSNLAPSNPHERFCRCTVCHTLLYWFHKSMLLFSLIDVCFSKFEMCSSPFLLPLRML